ncbi:MAG TPA: cell division protein FtsH, partial [Anaerolineae bacterium]|nr:cell division protein FtsH [Anaerolineae bacterium]
MNNGWSRNGFVYLLILVAAAALFFSIFPQTERSQPVDITQVAKWADRGEVEKIVVIGDELQVKRKGQDQWISSRKEAGESLAKTLLDLGVAPEKVDDFELVVKAPSEFGNWFAILGSLLPLVFVGALFFFLMRQAQGSNNQAIAFGKSRARLFTGDKPTVTFDDVAGAEEAKEELQE